MFVEKLRESLGDDYLRKIGTVFPFIENDGDILELYKANLEFNNVKRSVFIEWVVFKAKNGSYRTIRPCLSDIQKVYPNAKTPNDRDIVVSNFIYDEYGSKHFVHKGYFLFEMTDSAYRRYFESFHKFLKEMLHESQIN